MAIFNSILFTVGSAEKGIKEHLTVPVFSTKQQGCGIFKTCSGSFKELELGMSISFFVEHRRVCGDNKEGPLLSSMISETCDSYTMESIYSCPLPAV